MSNDSEASPAQQGEAVPTQTLLDEAAQEQTTSADAESPGSAEVPLDQRLEEALAKVAAWEQEYLRARADLENFRKRSAQEVMNASKFAIEAFAEALLPVADSMEMALSLENQTPEGLRSGVELTLKQLQQAFQKGKLVTIDPKGEKFDPNRHQAVSMVDGSTQDPPVAPNHVVQVMQKGYMVADRVLRPAIVLVAQ
jgi:molecular chaperone GrpE